jgi:hypothetical protein
MIGDYEQDKTSLVAVRFAVMGGGCIVCWAVVVGGALTSRQGRAMLGCVCCVGCVSCVCCWVVLGCVFISGCLSLI